MSEAEIVLPLSDARDISKVGGKAVNLARLLDADLPVPGGFVVTTRAFTQAGANGEIDETVANAIRQAYQAMGEPVVAVRSSATAEDLQGASMAGQYETFLGVQGGDEVIRAVEKCWQSLRGERVQSYLRKQQVDAADVSVAVVVQLMVDSEVSGVLFTANPRTGAEDEMVVEAVYGLGEGIVSGEVQPDVYRLRASSGEVLEIHVAEKNKALRLVGGGYESVPSDRANKACLHFEYLQQLHDLGLRCAKHFDCPQDCEWALSNGQIFLLQARPITTLKKTRAYHQMLEHARKFLRSEQEQQRGPWVRHNLGETLPRPTPLTWSLVQPFMSGGGGFGRMYERVGFAPGESVRHEGFLTLIAGEIYMDCARMPEMFCGGYPYTYDVALLRDNPDAAQQPPSLAQGSYGQLSRAAKLGNAVTANIRRLAENLDQQLDHEFLPAVEAWCNEQASLDLTSLEDEGLIELWQAQQRQVLGEFGVNAFLPSMVEALATSDLKSFLVEHIWDEEPDHLLQALAHGPTPDVTLQSNVALQEVGQGKRTLGAWLDDHGYRGPGEFDLANPRWRERPEELKALAGALADADDVVSLHEQRKEEAAHCLSRLKAKLPAGLGNELAERVTLVQRYLRFREDGKAILMRGFEQLRRTALEFARRLELPGDEVFFLERDELCNALRLGFVPRDRVEKRKLEHRVAATISLPRVIDQEDLDTLGEASPLGERDSWCVLSVSHGSCTGSACIVLDPLQTPNPGEGYILVCPSTDPAWTPLFIKASGLILERGGSLSHGAIVARELGLPAVILDGATALFREGELITVDANAGQVWRAQANQDGAAEARAAKRSQLTHVEQPPMAGAAEALANRRGAMAALLWLGLLAAMYMLPASWLQDPVFATIDGLLWPLVPRVGMPATVAIVGVFFGVIPLLIQRYFTDNRRLMEAKRRASRLRREAADLPETSGLRKLMLDTASSVTLRTLKASMAALAWVLGPMMAVFLWMPERMDPASWNADPGGLVTIVAKLDGEFQAPVHLDVPRPLALEDATPSEQALPAIRATLEELRREWQQSADLSDYPWEVQAAADQTRETMLASLNAFLGGNIPPQSLTWMVRVPSDVSGHYPVMLRLPEHPGQPLVLAFGNERPPNPNRLQGDSAPLIDLEAIYPRPLQKRQFWTPLAAVGGPSWDFGWLGVYILAYLTTMLIAKRLVGIP